MKGIADIEQQVELIEGHIARYRAEGKKLFATSSFQTHSIPMLHIISRIDRSIPIYFINTGYHFPDTVRFRDRVAVELGLNVIDHRPQIPKNMQRDASGNLYFTSDPDYCCYLNKTQPMKSVLAEMDVWINGVRADQNANRRSMEIEQPTSDRAVRFHPMLYWTGRMIFEYIGKYGLHEHPLDSKGYVSVGCEPCTRKMGLGDEREARWFGLKKTECGLHTDLIQKTN